MEQTLPMQATRAAEMRTNERDVERILADARAGIYRLALAIVIQPDLAEDVSQEVVVRCYRSRVSMLAAENRQAWIRRVTVRCACTALKSREGLAEQSREPSTRPAEHEVSVRAVLSTLSIEHRSILALVYFEGLSYQEIALDLEIPEGTVASRIHAAKHAFKTQWEAK